MRLRGDVDEAALEAALAAIARRHVSLRTYFVQCDGGEVLQAVLAAGDARAAPSLIRRGLPAARDARDAELARLAAGPFALVGGGVPLRVYLLTEEGVRGRVLLLSAHHAIRCNSQRTGHSVLCAVTFDLYLCMLARQGSVGVTQKLRLPALCSALHSYK